MRSVLFQATHASLLHLRLLRLGVRRALGVDRPLRILPYRGYGTPERALVKARVLEDRHAAPPEERQTLLDSAVSSYKRYATHEIPHAKVRVRWNDRVFDAQADDEGFVNQWVEPPPGRSTGWHTVQVELPEGGRGAAVHAKVFVAGSAAEFGVVSDLDDTVIVTGVTNPLKRAYALFLSEARTRLPFEGVNALYAALRDGVSGQAHNPIFYVSSSPWNLYEHLEEFFEVHDVPRGPLLLRDWGLTRTGFAPGGGHGHKVDRVREVMAAFPRLPFLLIGDSGQHDPEHYLSVVREHPGRVLAVYIRSVSRSRTRQAELRRIGEEMARGGAELVVVDDSVAAAEHAASKGWIRWRQVEQVEEKKHEDQSARSLVDALDRRP